MLLKLIYAANIVVTALVGGTALFLPRQARTVVFQGAFAESGAISIVGAFWLAISVVSVLGLLNPKAFAAVLLVQLLYKGGWLLVYALPRWFDGRSAEVPTAVAVFFAVWVLVLPFAIPWREWFVR